MGDTNQQTAMLAEERVPACLNSNRGMAYRLLRIQRSYPAGIARCLRYAGAADAEDRDAAKASGAATSSCPNRFEQPR